MNDGAERPAPETRERPRRPYETPAIAWEEEFAPYAFSGCGKMPGQGGPCMAFKRS
jgi:hypothetical protein